MALFITHYADSESGDVPPEPKPAAEKTFNQTQVNDVVEKRVAKMKAENRQMLQKFESLQANMQTNSEGREAMETELEELRQRTLSQDEIQKREAKKAQDKYSKDLEVAQASAKTWQNDYNDLRISNEITSASAGTKVLKQSYGMVESFLRPNTKLVELRDENGDPTGSYEGVVDFADNDDDGKPIVVQMSIPQAIKRMSDLPDKYGNLFEGQKIGGTGTNSGSGTPGSKADPSKMSTEDYLKFRKENPQAALGSV